MSQEQKYDRVGSSLLFIAIVATMALGSCQFSAPSSDFGTDICTLSQTHYEASQAVPIGSTLLRSTALTQSVQTGESDVIITKTKLGLMRQGWPTGRLTLKLEQDNAGKPSGLELTSATATLDFISDEARATSTLETYHQWFDFDFGTDVTLTANKTYWLVVRTSAAQNESTYPLWTASNLNPYTTGVGLYESTTLSGTQFTDLAITENRDLTFALCSPSPSPSPSPSVAVFEQELRVPSPSPSR